MPKANDIVSLSLVVSGDEGSVFPRAYLEDATGIPIGAIDLIHTANGRYIGQFTMPNNDVYANYIVYSDSGRTIKDVLFDQAGEVFSVFDVSQILPKASSIIAKFYGGRITAIVRET